MPYLDLTDEEQYLHMVQLFLAAHPHDRAINEAARAQAGLPGAYFLAQESMHRMAAWARERRLIRRKDAARLREVAAESFPRPDVTLPARSYWIPGSWDLRLSYTDDIPFSNL
jgi:hypothetical protein